MKRLAIFAAIVMIAPASSFADENILSTAASNGSFNTLVSLVVAADLDEALQSKGEFTVFAPTDEAFAKLPKGTLKDLLKPENKDQLAKILTYHVVSGKVTALDAVSAGKAKTLANQSVSISIKDGRIQINNAKLINNDIKASNGIIHVIDAVLLPGQTSTHTTSTPTKTDASEITITSDWDSPVNRDGITADKIIIRCGGAGRIRLTNVTAKTIVTTIGGGGSVSLEGTVADHKVNVSGGAVLRARDLISQTTEIQVNGGGDAEINATKSLIARANGGATLRYVETDAKITKTINKYAKFTPLTMKTKGSH